MQDTQSLFTVCPETTDNMYVWALRAAHKGKEGCVPCFEKPSVPSDQRGGRQHMEFKIARIMYRHNL